MKKLRVAIAGVTGYTGQALLKILLKHPFLEICNLYSSRYGGKHFFDLEKSFLSYKSQIPKLENLEVKKLELEKLDCLFLATPNGFASQVVKELCLSSNFFFKSNQTKIIDLAADFRLENQKIFQEYYGFSVQENFLKESVYGLSEFVDPRELKEKKIIANPGCYPTCVLLALLPLLKENLIDTKTACIIDAKSGVTGAGKKANEDLIFGEVSECFKAYKVNKHRHTPEITEKILQFSGKNLKVRFIPHLLPIKRGMLSSIYLKPRQSLDFVRLKQLESKINSTYEKYYRDSSFVRMVGTPPKTSDVLNTNNCLIYANFDRETEILNIISVIDNLVKGAAGQAVQNFNLSFGIKQESGLL